MRKNHRTVDRVAAILEAVVRAPAGLTLSELARRTDAPLSSVQKLADGLVAVGYLDEGGRRYTLGPAPSVLSWRAGRPVHAVAHADLEALHAETGTPVLLAVRMGDDGVYVDWAGADEPLDFALSSRIRAPLLDTAAGRVLLAHLPDRERRAVVVAARPDPAEVVEALTEAERIRRAGRVRGPSGPLLPDAAAVAVPVHRDGTVVAALAATVDADADDAVLDTCTRTVAAAAQRWSSAPS